MEDNIKAIEKELLEKVTACVLNTDCIKISRIFETAGWRWAEGMTNNHFIPNDRDVRSCLVSLGKATAESIADQLRGGKESPTSTVSSGRLYFHIEVEESSDEMLLEVTLECGIDTDMNIEQTVITKP